MAQVLRYSSGAPVECRPSSSNEEDEGKNGVAQLPLLPGGRGA